MKTSNKHYMHVHIFTYIYIHITQHKKYIKIIGVMTESYIKKPTNIIAFFFYKERNETLRDDPVCDYVRKKIRGIFFQFLFAKHYI